MAKIFPIFVKRIINNITQSGAAVWQPVIKPAIKLQFVLSTLFTMKPAVKLSQAPSNLLSKLLPAVKLSSFVNGTVKPQQKTAVQMKTLLRQNTPPSQKEAAKLQYFLNLTGTYGGASQTNTGWTNGANALGKHDSVNATVTGSLTAATGGALIMTYATLPNKTNLTISSVKIQPYGSQTGTVLGNGNYLVEYSINGGTSYTTANANNTGNFTTLTATDITSVIAGNWANLQNFRVRVTSAYAAANTASSTLDAVELLVTASLPITTP